MWLYRSLRINKIGATRMRSKMSSSINASVLPAQNKASIHNIHNSYHNATWNYPESNTISLSQLILESFYYFAIHSSHQKLTPRIQHSCEVLRLHHNVFLIAFCGTPVSEILDRTQRHSFPCSNHTVSKT